MKQLMGIIIITLVITCGGGNKKPQETTLPPTPTYTFQTPTEEMLDSGKTTFHSYCYICHENAIGEVTMLTDKARWTVNRANDIETLVQHVQDGYTGNYGTMPPKGACKECSEDDLRNATFYMMREARFLE
ncbi:c-type cytochrome [Candidatus Neomarinimicrobiota bacterium]